MALSLIKTNSIAASAITSALIADGTVVAADIAANSVDSSELVDGSIDTSHIATAQVTLAKMAVNSIDSDQYVDGSIDFAHMSVNSINSDQYVDGSIDTAHIAASQITNALMADDAIDSAEIVAGSIDTAHMADNQVTLAKMAGLVRGKIIIGDASGDPAALTVGSSGQALVSDGTDISWGVGGAAVGSVNTWTAGQRGEVTALSSGTTITIDMANSNNFKVTLAHNATFANPSNDTAGQSGSIFLTQDGTGSRTASWASDWDFAGGTAPTLTTTAAAVDRIDYVILDSTNIHAVATLNLS